RSLLRFTRWCRSVRKFSPLIPHSGLITAGLLSTATAAALSRMAIEQLPAFIRENYVHQEWRHATSILATDFPKLFEELCDVLSRFRLKKSEIVVAGGSKTKIAGWIDAELRNRGWAERQFKTAFQVDDRRIESPTHKVDCFKATDRGGIGFEIEWN